MDKAHIGRSDDAHGTARHRQQTNAGELLAISKLHPIVRLSHLAELLSMQQTNLEHQLGELDTGKEAMSHSDRVGPRIAEGIDGKDEGLSTRPEDFRLFMNRVPPIHDSGSDYDTGYETASLLSNTVTSDTASSAVSEYRSAVEWPIEQELQSKRHLDEGAQWRAEQAQDQAVNDIIKAHYEVVEKQAEHIYRLTNVASQLEAEFRQFAEEEQIEIKHSTDRIDGLLEIQAATNHRLLRADNVIKLNNSLAEDVKQLGSNLQDADAKKHRLKHNYQAKEQSLDFALRKIDSLDKMYTYAIEVKKQLETKVGRKDALIAVLKEQVDRQTIDITSLNDEMNARADESRMLRIQRDRCVEMCEEQIKNFEKL